MATVTVYLARLHCVRVVGDLLARPLGLVKRLHLVLLGFDMDELKRARDGVPRHRHRQTKHEEESNELGHWRSL
jgi:hypothetical protein